MPPDGVGVFVDWENIKVGLQRQLDISPSPRVLRKLARRYGTLAVARAYADWANEGRGAESLFREGIVPVFALAGRVAGEMTKNSVDVLLAMECVRLGINNPAIRTIIIAGGDFAYANLVPLAHSEGKHLVVVAVSTTTSSVLSRLADEFVSYEALVAGLQASAETALRPGERRKRLGRVKEAFRVLKEAVDELRSAREGGAIEHDAAALKNLMRKRLPDFEEEQLGFERFRHFLFAGERKGFLRVDTREEHPVVYGSDEEESDEGRLLLSPERWLEIARKLKTPVPVSRASQDLGEDIFRAAEESRFIRRVQQGINSRDGRVASGEPLVVRSEYDERVHVYRSS